MEAIEFKTIIHNGAVVIPPQYSSQWEGKVIRVIVLDDAELLSKPVEKLKKTIFQAISLNTQGFDFNREEANVR
ncbi:MAG TPA: hypothetical protein VK184_09300 [Nostocaceae cyanobacterium]|nr:hypothetical protein [Nostocaceae cyanobacterium]